MSAQAPHSCLPGRPMAHDGVRQNLLATALWAGPHDVRADQWLRISTRKNAFEGDETDYS
jgi:hypothetical protein